MHTEEVTHSMNAYVWCWIKICGSLDEIPSVTMGSYKSKYLINSNMTLTVLNLHQKTEPKVQKVLKVKVTTTRSNQGHTMMLHTYNP